MKMNYITLFSALLLSLDAAAGNYLHFDHRGNFVRNSFSKNIQGAIGVFHTTSGIKYFEFSDISSVMGAIYDYGVKPTIFVLPSEDLKKCVDAAVAPLQRLPYLTRLLEIKRESDGGKSLDLACGIKHKAVLGAQPYQDEFYLIDGIAYDSFDGGNYLWGMAMKALRIPFSYVKIGSELNAVFYSKDQNLIQYKNWLDSIEWTGDSETDQRAIRRGYNRYKP